MKPEHDERFRRIADVYLDRPGGDYAELLRRGEVSSPEGVDPELWRAKIRAKARADKIRVMTIRSGDRAIAAVRRTVPKDQEFASFGPSEGCAMLIGRRAATLSPLARSASSRSSSNALTVARLQMEGSTPAAASLSRRTSCSSVGGRARRPTRAFSCSSRASAPRPISGRDAQPTDAAARPGDGPCSAAFTGSDTVDPRRCFSIVGAASVAAVREKRLPLCVARTHIQLDCRFARALGRPRRPR